MSQDQQQWHNHFKQRTGQQAATAPTCTGRQGTGPSQRSASPLLSSQPAPPRPRLPAIVAAESDRTTTKILHRALPRADATARHRRRFRLSPTPARALPPPPSTPPRTSATQGFPPQSIPRLLPPPIPAVSTCPPSDRKKPPGVSWSLAPWTLPPGLHQPAAFRCRPPPLLRSF